jgi:CelD/BcsL family acetyltransferase involved in cellulose biosynthesis
LPSAIVPVRALSAADISEWRELGTRAIEPNPFHEPDFVLPVARHLGGDGLALLRARRRGELVACVPVHHARGWKHIPWRVLATWTHPYTFLGSPLLDGRDPEAAVADLLAALETSAGTGLLAFERSGGGSGVGRAIRSGAASRGWRVGVYSRFQRAALVRRPEATYSSGLIGSRRAKALRRVERRLAEALDGDVRLVDRSGEASSVEGFLAMEASGWKGRAGSAMATSGRDASFFREMCAAFAAAGRLQLLVLEGAGTPVAMQCNLVGGRGVFCFKVAYDEQFGRLSPGVQLELRAIEHFHANTGFDWMDSCAEPDNDTINGLWPDRRPIETIVIAGSAVMNRALAAGLPWAVAWKARVTQAARAGAGRSRRAVVPAQQAPRDADLE